MVVGNDLARETHTVKGLPFWGRVYLGFGSITVPGPQGEGRRGGIWEWRCPLTGQDSVPHRWAPSHMHAPDIQQTC